MRYVIGIDLGTSSLKAILLRQDGVVAATAARSYPIHVQQPGWAEQMPADWWQACCYAIKEILHACSAAPANVVALTVGGQMHGTVLLDDAAMPLRPAIIWPDQRAAVEAQAAETALAARGLLPTLGGGVSPGFMLASLLWCRTHEPDCWARTATALLPKDYLVYRLTGVLSTEPSDGSGIPLIDLQRWEWSQAAMAVLDLPSRLFPPLRSSGTLVGFLIAAAAEATGLVAGTPVVCGGSDQALGGLGAGLFEPGAMLISISTGGQIVAPLHNPLPQPAHGLRTICHAIPGAYLALAPTLAAGLSLQWFRDTVVGENTLAGEAKVLEMAASAPPGAAGLLFLPYVAGERAPILDPKASGAFIGLRLDHGRAHMARAVLEGVACSLRHALEPLQAAGARADRVILAGGLARSPLMCALVASMLGQEVRAVEVPEQSALGAALLAACHAGFFADLPEACAATVRYGALVAPDLKHRTLYDSLYATYCGLYPKLREDMHALHNLAAWPAE